ncbi:MAG: hypothetical protein IPN34_16620 [Planctomycetes bacterium]|nr:hypothetical protein [Planctomycetota bacterium]
MEQRDMKHSKLPSDAFDHHFSLGVDRSYTAVAKRYAVARKTVNRHAIAERWQERIAERERKAREATEQRAIETLEEMNARHLRVAKAIQARALDALRTLPLSTAMEAVRALEIGVKQERLARGEPTDRAAIDVESVIKREYERWLVRTDDTPRN